MCAFAHTLSSKVTSKGLFSATPDRRDFLPADKEILALRCFGWVVAHASVVLRRLSTGELGNQLAQSFHHLMLQAGSYLWICGQRACVAHKSTGTATTTQRRSSIS